MSLEEIPKIFVFGGARSGKSRYAEKLVLGSGRKPVYVATSEVRDDEMEERVLHHQNRRGPEWDLVECPLDIADVIRDESDPSKILLIDCLTLWLTNVWFSDRDLQSGIAQLSDAIETAKGPVVAVSNEVGMGIVPETKLGREFRDEQGRLNQRIAALSSHVFFVAAGLPLCLKPVKEVEINL